MIAALRNRFPGLIKLPTFVCLAVALLPSVGSAQTGMLEEIVVGFEVPKLISKDIFVQYDGSTVFVPIIEVFSTLKFPLQANLASDRISGQMPDPTGEMAKFLIDLTRFNIKALGTERELLRSDYYLDDRDFYLRIDLFDEIFGMKMKFDFSLLRVWLPLNKEYPVYQKLKRGIARNKMVKKKEALRDVHILPRERSYVAGGVLDWRISANPIGGGSQHYNFDLGGLLLGGDLKLGGAGNSRTGFESEQVDYRWHYFLNEGKYLTQVDVGRVFMLGALGRSITGLRLTNQPQIRRKYFRTIDLSGAPGPGWEVELYIDGKLADFQTTDESGQYDFNVDVFYGASNVEVRMYGPNGQMETQYKHYRIPFNLIPQHQIEYTTAVGNGLGAESDQAFAQSTVYYGLLPQVTTGLSVDLPLKPLLNEKPLYSFETTVQAAANLTMSGTLSPNNRAEINANFTWPRVASLGAHATVLSDNMFTNPTRQKSRWQVSLSSPLKIFGHRLGLRFNISHNKFAASSNTSMTYGFNTSIKPIHFNYVGQYIQKQVLTGAGNQAQKEMSSKIMGSIQLHRKFRPQFHFSYDHTLNQPVRYGVMFTQRLWRSAQLSFSYDRNPLANMNSISVDIHFFTDFIDISSRTQMAGDNVTMTQQQRGSIRYDQNHKRFMFDRRRSVGYGSAVVTPFLDENYNGLKDPTEENLSGLKAKITGVGGRPRGSDRVYYYDRLRPYDEYLVQIDKYSLDDPTLKPSNENYKVTLNPSIVTSIEVPIVTASEISGSVERKVGSGTTGVGGIRLMLLNISKDVLTEVMTFTDGEYYYMGLLPGSYRAYLDPEQISRAGYRSEPESIEFDIKPIVGGEVIEGIKFLMVPLESTNSSR